MSVYLTGNSCTKHGHRRSTMVRIAANYARLASVFALGLVLVRALLHFGSDAFGAILLLGVATGLTASIRDLMISGLVPPLGDAYHSGEDEVYRARFSAATLISLTVASFSASVLILGALFVDRANLPPELTPGARLFLLAKAAEALAIISSAPIMAVYLVRERIGSLNAWIVGERAGDALAAVGVAFSISWFTPSAAVGLYGAVSAVVTAILAGAGLILCPGRPQLSQIRLGGRSRDEMPSVLRSIGWNAAVALASNFYAPASLVVVNYWFGTFGSLVFGMARQFAFYLRQLAMGIALGVDAVAARLAHTSTTQATETLLHRSTFMQASVIAPIAILLIVYAEPALELWAGPRLAEEPGAASAVVLLVRLLILGVAARGVSETWMRTLAGRGRVREYAAPVLIGAIVNTGAAATACMLAAPAFRLSTPAIVLSLVLCVVHLIWLPKIVARHCGISYRTVVDPVVRPAIAALVTAPVLAFSWGNSQWRTAVATTAYLSSYAAIWYFATGPLRKVAPGDDSPASEAADLLRKAA